MGLPLADIGVPMLGVYWPPAWLALIPIIALEGWLARRDLQVTWKAALLTTGLANAVSTLVGIPIAWVAWTVLELRFFGTAQGLSNPATVTYAFTVQAPWLIPYESSLWWLMPLSVLSMSIVFCFLSIVIEWGVARFFFSTADRVAVRNWAWKANLASYCGLFCFVVICMYVPAGAVSRVSSPAVWFFMNQAWRLAGGSDL